jgi:saccharopine dehydrogenase (NAD+, L-lysine-forming)
VQTFLKRRIERHVRGPGPEERERGSVELWGRAEDAQGNFAEGTMVVPEGYRFTAEAALASVRRVRGGVAPGAWTPSLAFGADFAASLPGVTVRV